MGQILCANALEPCVREVAAQPPQPAKVFVLQRAAASRSKRARRTYQRGDATALD